jgi:hypothetical protein
MTNIPPEFNDWWDKDELTTDNPYREGTPAYWAWEGWQAGTRSVLKPPPLHQYIIGCDEVEGEKP